MARNENLKELTKAEEQVMRVLWDMERAFVKEIIGRLPEPRPAYNTVSTIVRILESKGFADHEAFGKSHRYYPLISREEYRAFTTDSLMRKYFDNSHKKLISFFVREKKMDISELEELLEKLKKQE